MLDRREFKAAMARKGYSQKMLAKAIGVSEQTLTRKIKRGVFGTDEVSMIVSVLEIHDPGPIFFADEVAQWATKTEATR